jgi:hypothetical protein
MSHQGVTVSAVMAHEVRDAVATRLSHSQYDTNATSYRHCAAPQYSGELSADAIPIRA